MAYRAFGLKQMSYANGRTLSLQYDNRLRPTQWNIPGVMGWNYGYSYFGENTGRVIYGQNLNDATLDRSYDYDQAGRLLASHTGSEARAHVGVGPGGTIDGPYSQRYYYDQWGNITGREGWGGANPQYGAGYTNNKMNGMVYDAAGNLADAGGGWTFTYDATGQQATSAMYNLQQYYDGDRLRGKKVESGVATYYLRSSVLGGQVIAEINGSGAWVRGYVYLGGEMLAVQQGGVYWMYQDPVAKSKRVTDGSGNVVSTIELDPWGGETNRSSNEAFQPHKFSTYEHDVNASDDAMHRRYNRWWSRFEQPDPYDGSYDFSNPQSFNRYIYVQNDPVNATDPSGLEMSAFCGAEFSFSECGGGGGFWGGGGGFGGDVGRYNREYEGMPANMASALGAHNERVQNSLDAIAANAAYQQAVRSGRPEDMARALKMIAANPTLHLVAVLSKADQTALGWIAAKYGQGVADQTLFNAVAALTGLSNYMNGPANYDPATRTFSIDFKPEVEKFLANSPYFAGPGIALLHSDVGTFDYRSYTDMTGGSSLQIVLGNGRNIHRSYGDFDEYNPYQDVVSFVRHNVPIIFRRVGRIFH